MKTVKCDDVGLAAVADVLNSGGVAVIPTDTVYGLAASPEFPAAVERLYEIKGRDGGKPIAFLASGAAATGISSPLARFWPGALTIVYGGVGYRVPDHRWTRALIEKCGGLLKVTSANLSGSDPATDIASLAGAVEEVVDIVADGGPSRIGVPSTVVRILEDGGIETLRRGAIEIDTENAK